jgi:hypothetical protein
VDGTLLVISLRSEDFFFSLSLILVSSPTPSSLLSILPLPRSPPSPGHALISLCELIPQCPLFCLPWHTPSPCGSIRVPASLASCCTIRAPKWLTPFVWVRYEICFLNGLFMKIICKKVKLKKYTRNRPLMGRISGPPCPSCECDVCSSIQTRNGN